MYELSLVLRYVERDFAWSEKMHEILFNDFIPTTNIIRVYFNDLLVNESEQGV